MCWKAMSDPTGVTAPITVMPMPDLAGPENLQKGVTKILLGNGGKIQGTFFFFFPHFSNSNSNFADSMVKPKTVTHPYSDIC